MGLSDPARHLTRASWSKGGDTGMGCSQAPVLAAYVCSIVELLPAPGGRYVVLPVLQEENEDWLVRSVPEL